MRASLRLRVRLKVEGEVEVEVGGWRLRARLGLEVLSAKEERLT